MCASGPVVVVVVVVAVLIELVLVTPWGLPDRLDTERLTLRRCHVCTLERDALTPAGPPRDTMVWALPVSPTDGART